MTGEQRAKTRGAQSPAEAGGIPGKVSALHLAGREGQVGGPRSQSSHQICQISHQGPWTVLPASRGKGQGAEYAQAGRPRVGPTVLLWLSFTTSRQPLGAGFLAAVPGSW